MKRASVTRVHECLTCQIELPETWTEDPKFCFCHVCMRSQISDGKLSGAELVAEGEMALAIARAQSAKLAVRELSCEADRVQARREERFKLRMAEGQAWRAEKEKALNVLPLKA